MTPLHRQVKMALMPPLIEITTAAREVREKLNSKKDEIYRNVELVWKKEEKTSDSYKKFLLDMVAAATNQPQLRNIARANGSYAPLEPLTVITPIEVSEEAASYGIIGGFPYLVMHGIDKTLLAPDGHLVDEAYDPGSQYKSFPSSDLEIEQFLDNLTGAQLRVILGNDLFAPYLEQMFESPEEEPKSQS